MPGLALARHHAHDRERLLGDPNHLTDGIGVGREQLIAHHAAEDRDLRMPSRRPAA
jgi:hypothetical protein